MAGRRRLVLVYIAGAAGNTTGLRIVANSLTSPRSLRIYTDMTPQALIPALLVPLIGYRLYRRFRSNFGPQPIQTKRMVTRIVIFAVLAVLFMGIAIAVPSLIGAALCGLAVGAAVGVVGLRLTSFQFGPNGKFYTPNPYIGGSITALLVARIVYRFMVVAPVIQESVRQAQPDPLAMYRQSPLTLAIFMVTVGYYITYFAGVLLKARHAPPAP